MTGNLLITSNPKGANIYIDNKDTQMITPASFVLENGMHQYALKKTFHDDAIGYIEISEGENYVLDVTLQSELTRYLVNVSSLALIVSVVSLIWKRK